MSLWFECAFLSSNEVEHLPMNYWAFCVSAPVKCPLPASRPACSPFTNCFIMDFKYSYFVSLCAADTSYGVF